MPKIIFVKMGLLLEVGILSAIVGVSTSLAHATLLGTTLTPPGSSVFPGFVAPGTSPGTLLATLSTPFSYSTTAGTTSGVIDSAVYQEAGGTLDFYYQVMDNASSATSIARLTATDFAGFLVSTGFRADGSTLVGSGFVDGTVAPVTADDSITGAVVGFSFNPPVTEEINPGLTSLVLVISTNATNFTAGNATVIDGGSQTVASFEPAPLRATPEPSSLFLLGSGVLGLAGVVRKRFA